MRLRSFKIVCWEVRGESSEKDRVSRCHIFKHQGTFIKELMKLGNRNLRNAGALIIMLRSNAKTYFHPLYPLVP